MNFKSIFIFLINIVFFIVFIPVIITYVLLEKTTLWNDGVCRKCQSGIMRLDDYDSDRLYQIWKCDCCGSKRYFFLERNDISTDEGVRIIREKKLRKLKF